MGKSEQKYGEIWSQP